MSQDDLIDQAIDAGIHQAEDANPEANVGVPIDDMFASQLTERRARLKSAAQGSGMASGLSRNVIIAGVVALVVLVLLFRGK